MSFSDDLRMRVKDRANFACCWCRDQEKKVEVHHIVPQAEGGLNIEDNAAPLCSNCHTLYGGNTELRKEIRARRDNWYKLCSKEHVLVSQADIQAILQRVKTRDPEVEPKVIQPAEDATWKLIYELSLPEQPVEPAGSLALEGWQFAFNSPAPRITLYSNAILGIGGIDNTVSACSPITRIHNCRVECDIRIMEHGVDPSNWAGFRIRGIHHDLTLGYLAFLRADGRFDIHRVDEVIHSVSVAKNLRAGWTNIRLDMIEDQIAISVNGSQLISITDKWFGGFGNIYVHTFGAHALFRNLRIFALKNYGA